MFSRRSPRVLVPTALAVSLALSAFTGCDDGDWWDGDDEPDYTGKADGDIPLTIFLSKEQTTIRKALSVEELGDLSRGRTGKMNLDGRTLSQDVVLIFDGTLHRYDGGTDRIRATVKPTYISHDNGSANPDGFLKVDFKSTDDYHNHEPGVPALASRAGIFRGDIVATEEVLMGEDVPEDLRHLYIRPQQSGQRPPNLIRDAEVFITPNVAITRLSPATSSDSCFGDNIVDVTLSKTDLAIEVMIEGFSSDRPVTVELIRRDPHSAGGGFLSHIWDPVSGLWSDDIDETVHEVRLDSPTTDRRAVFPVHRTLEAGFGSDQFRSYYEVRAYTSKETGAFAMPFLHELMVVDRGDEIIVDQFELCPFEDDACRALRDKFAPDNVVARRNVLEWKAAGQGLYDTITRPIGACSGGDTVAGGFADDCKVYREETDSELSVRVAAELEFELSANGTARGEGSWGGSIGGLGTAEVEAAFKAEFKLEADLKASFETSRTWRDRHSLDVIYDPQDTQLQWWRVVTPRLRYLEVAEFNACGARTVSNELFLSDLRDSRLVLACEAVPSFDTVCHSVEPTEGTVNACDQLLIDPQSSEGQQCLAD